MQPTMAIQGEPVAITHSNLRQMILAAEWLAHQVDMQPRVVGADVVHELLVRALSAMEDVRVAEPALFGDDE